ncbi:MAG TPA: DNA gyrase inhibitor YacG, partial [Burkholderiales bacterium]|nr:DNA gyrase inhibitor YacG [Burkholderiales bacterium]
MQSVRKVRCPRCGKPVLYSPNNKWRPFCNERCKMIDLGLWGSDAYSIPDKTPLQDDG